MTPVPPIALEGVDGSPRSHIGARRVTVGEATLGRLRDACAEVTTDVAEVGDASRDWWPLAMQWALEGEVPGLASVIVRPQSADEVAAVLAVCNADLVPVTAAGGRSGVCGASVPIHGGVVLDLCGLSGIVDVDDDSLVLDVRPGTFGEPLEADLRRDHGVTLGHWPQSMAISTVGGWLACRGAGQLSTRYGKIEDMVVGLDVALADGRRITTGGAPRQAVGPDLTQLFVGSEGTLGVITGARLRVHPAPAARTSRRLELRGVRRWARGLSADPAQRRDSCRAPALRRPRGEPQLPDRRPPRAPRVRRGRSGVDRRGHRAWSPRSAMVLAVSAWTSVSSIGGSHHRNDVRRARGADPEGVRGRHDGDRRLVGATSRRSTKRPAPRSSACPHAAPRRHTSRTPTPTVRCLYFTFAGRPPADEREPFYVAAWDAGTRAVLANGGALSATTTASASTAAGSCARRSARASTCCSRLKSALDPNGILNPGKLGLPSPVRRGRAGREARLALR